MVRTKPWKVSDEFWEKVEPLIPPALPRQGRQNPHGRPRCLRRCDLRAAYHRHPVERLAQGDGGLFHRTRSLPGMGALRVLRGAVESGAPRRVRRAGEGIEWE